MVDINIIKELRNQTGHSIGKCKEVLEEAGGDIEKANELLRDKGAMTSEKKQNRTLNSGVVSSYVHTTNKTGAIVELLCETDFVANNEEFIDLARNIAIHSTAFNPRYVSREDVPEEILKQMKDELKDEVDDKKPEEIREKILSGMINSKLKEFVLLEQPYLKDDKRSIKQIVDEAVQKFGERIEVDSVTVKSI